MKLYKVKVTCFWGPQPGTETLHHKGEEIMLHGTEAHISEFFEPVEKTPVHLEGADASFTPAAVSVVEVGPFVPVVKAKAKPGPKPKKPAVEDLNDL